MKKNLFFVAAFAMALASCSNDEVVELTQSNGISFRTSLENASRAVYDSKTLPEAFKVHAFEGTTEYFNDEVKNEGSAWNTVNNIYYWPIGNKLSFFGYAPTTWEATVTSATISKDNYTIDPDADEDIIVAYTKEAVGPDAVQMNFRHALSQIVIKAKNSSSVYTVDITEVKIANVKQTGKFTFEPLESTSAVAQGESLDNVLLSNVWEPTTNGTLTSYTRTPSNAILSPLSGTTAVEASLLTGTTESPNPFLLLPQTLTGATFEENDNGTYISVKCKIYKENGNNDIVIFPSEGDYGESAVALSGTWDPGKKYIYTLNFLGANAGGGQDPDGGEDILNPITFTVTVDDWSEQTGSTLNMGTTTGSTGE